MNKFAGFFRRSRLVFASLGAASTVGGGLYLSTLPIVPSPVQDKIRYGSIEKDEKPQNGVWAASVYEEGVAKQWDSNWDL